MINQVKSIYLSIKNNYIVRATANANNLKEAKVILENENVVKLTKKTNLFVKIEPLREGIDTTQNIKKHSLKCFKLFLGKYHIKNSDPCFVYGLLQPDANYIAFNVRTSEINQYEGQFVKHSGFPERDIVNLPTFKDSYEFKIISTDGYNRIK